MCTWLRTFVNVLVLLVATHFGDGPQDAFQKESDVISIGHVDQCALAENVVYANTSFASSKAPPLSHPGAVSSFDQQHNQAVTSSPEIVDPVVHVDAIRLLVCNGPHQSQVASSYEQHCVRCIPFQLSSHGTNAILDFGEGNVSFEPIPRLIVNAQAVEASLDDFVSILVELSETVSHSLYEHFLTTSAFLAANMHKIESGELYADALKFSENAGKVLVSEVWDANLEFLSFLHRVIAPAVPDFFPCEDVYNTLSHGLGIVWKTLGDVDMKLEFQNLFNTDKWNRNLMRVQHFYNSHFRNRSETLSALTTKWTSEVHQKVTFMTKHYYASCRRNLQFLTILYKTAHEVLVAISLHDCWNVILPNFVDEVDVHVTLASKLSEFGVPNISMMLRDLAPSARAGLNTVLACCEHVSSFVGSGHGHIASFKEHLSHFAYFSAKNVQRSMTSMFQAFFVQFPSRVIGIYAWTASTGHSTLLLMITWVVSIGYSAHLSILSASYNFHVAVASSTYDTFTSVVAATYSSLIGAMSYCATSVMTIAPYIGGSFVIASLATMVVSLWHHYKDAICNVGK